MNRNLRLIARGIAISALVFSASSASAYSPFGPVPQAAKIPAAKLWTTQEVNAVVDVSYVTIDGYEPVSQYGAPAACDKLSFLRFRNRFGDGNPEHSDADLLMVPGILEGANGFDFIGRQLVYIAHRQYGRNIEVWAMDRRANCLEDQTGMHAAEQAVDAESAKNTLIGYYYSHQAINGKTFDGFLTSSQLPYLYNFGMRQTTQDMFAVIQYMAPHADVRRKKVFVGGHSLGGIHTSAFLAWNLLGDPKRTDYAGYNWCAGAFGFDTAVGPLGTPAGTGFLPPPPSEPEYQNELSAIQSGELARELYVPGIIGPEVIALPQAAGLLADKDPQGESTVLKQIPHSAELTGMLDLLNVRNLDTIFKAPTFDDFRYTNQAMVGLVFDDNFSPLSFLQAGLGFLHGGAVVRKVPLLEKIVSSDSNLGAFLTMMFGTQTHYVAANAGPDLQHLGQGPVYDWLRRDQIGNRNDPNYTDLLGNEQFTYLINEPTDIRDFTAALHEGPTNFTEWYFPMRLVMDSFAVSAKYATKYGMDVYYPEGPKKVPSLLIEAEQGLSGHKVGDPSPFPEQQLIVAPGFTHLDPMFESVNSPTQQDYSMRPLIEFVLAHAR